MTASLQLKIADLSFSFKYLALFEDFDLELQNGEIAHLIGPNGVGKSTLMSILAGLRTETNGSVACFLDGVEQEELSEHIEYIPADANGLYLKMDAMENLRFWMGLRGVDPSEQELIDTLSHWGVGHHLVRQNFAVEKFSTGMRRRLALARMSLSNAKILLLDEPLYGLDVHGVDLFKTMLRKHKEHGGAALVISHDTLPLEGIVSKTVELRRPH